MRPIVIVAFAALTASAQAGQVYPGSAAAGAIEGGERAQLQNLVMQCVRACGQDGYCQAQCLAPLSHQGPPRYQYQAPATPAPMTDYACVSTMQRAGQDWGMAMRMCTH